jgi:hypothetical protein
VGTKTESLAIFYRPDSVALRGKSIAPVESHQHPHLVTTEPPLSHHGAPVESQ